MIVNVLFVDGGPWVSTNLTPSELNYMMVTGTLGNLSVCAVYGIAQHSPEGDVLVYDFRNFRSGHNPWRTLNLRSGVMK